MEWLDFQLLLFISAYSLSLYSVLTVLVFMPLFVELSAGNPSESQSVSLPMLATLWAEVVFLFSLGCVLPLPDRLVWCHHLSLSVLHRTSSVLARVWLLTTPPVHHPAGPDGCTSSVWCLPHWFVAFADTLKAIQLGTGMSVPIFRSEGYSTSVHCNFAFFEYFRSQTRFYD